MAIQNHSIVLSTAQVALREFAIQAASATGPLSLLSWKHCRADLTDLTDETWLMFAYLQLKGSGLRVEFVQHAELDPFSINEGFQDIEVRCPLPLAG